MISYREDGRHRGALCHSPGHIKSWQSTFFSPGPFATAAVALGARISDPTFDLKVTANKIEVA